MNMKKIYTILLALAALLAVSCTRELGRDSLQGDVVVRITLDDMEVKSAPTADEKKVNSLYVYVFKSDGTTPLYYSGKLENPTLVSGKNYYEQSTNLTALGASEADVKTAKVFALANYPGSDLDGSENLADLKAKTLSGIVPDALVMRAEGVFTSGGANLTVANLSLKHVACKVVLKVKFPTSVVTSGTDASFGTTTITWTPMTNDTNFRVMLQNAVSNGKVDGSAATSPTSFDYPVNYMQDNGSEGFISPEFYSYPFEWTAAADTEPYIKVILPWSFVTTADQDGTPVVINRNIVERYYKIMLKDLTKFESNTCYMPEVTLTVKDGEENEPILVMPDGLRVLPWGLVGGPGGAQLSNVVVTDRKFIAVASSELKAERGAKASFEVFASGPLNMVIKNIYRTKFIKTNNPASLAQVGTDIDGNGGMRKDYIVLNGAINSYSYTPVDGSPTESYDYSSWVDAGGRNPLSWVSYADNGSGGLITLHHTLSTQLSSVDFAVTPYIYELELSLVSDPSYVKEITIEQIPSILASNALSSGYVYINNQTNRETGFTTKMNVTTNNPVYITEKMSDYFNSAVTSSAAAVSTIGYLPKVNLEGYTTKCKFRFNFKVVPYDDEHIVADPRVSVTGDNAFAFTRIGSGQTYATGLPITQDYYSSIATSGGVSYLGATSEPHFVSPGFMVASSYGAISGPVHYGGALLRCATYQEDGYPAGRWRLPTEAELQFMVELQNKKIIPKIMADGTWASSGRVYSGSSFGIPTEGAGHTCRCVYDTWYWGDEPAVGNTVYTVKLTK